MNFSSVPPAASDPSASALTGDPALMKALRDVDYPYMVMPDHVPHHADPASSNQAFAFAYGYIKALIQSMS